MTVTVDRFEGDRVVLRADDGHECTVPVGELPTGTVVGSALTVYFVAGTDEARVQRAKDILNEILGSNE